MSKPATGTKVPGTQSDQRNDALRTWGRVARLLESGAGVGVGLALALIAEIVFFSVKSPYFLTSSNVSNIGRAIAIIGITAVGETIVIISGGFDLSVGATMATSGMVSGYLVGHGASFGLSIAAALGIGLLIGAVNGAVVSYARINPLIATLATLSIIRGFGFVVSSGDDLIINNQTYLNLGTNSVAGVPITVVILLVTFVVFGVAMPRTLFGRYAYAIGSSSRASRLAGVRLHRWRMAFYITCGGLAALSGIVTVARTGTAQPSANIGVELDVITAVILGGTSLTGGRGRLAGTLVGLVLIGTLNNGLVLIGVQSYWQQVVKGAVLLVAVFWDEGRRRRRAEE